MHPAIAPDLKKSDILRLDYLELKLVYIIKHKVAADMIHVPRSSWYYHPLKIIYQCLLWKDFHADDEALYNKAADLEHN